MEWNNRLVRNPYCPIFFLELVVYTLIDYYSNFNSGISTVHAIFITAMSLYFVFWSDLFSDQQHTGPITFRSSWLSNFGLGVSIFSY